MRLPLLLALGAAAAHAGLVPASDPAFAYHGRVDRTHPAAPVLVWESSAVSALFRGPQLALRFGPATGQNYFNLTVDGVTDIIAVPEGTGAEIPYPRPLDKGPHRLVLTKRSEASCGTATFLGLVDQDGRARPSPLPSHLRRFLFYGDSITAGACNEDGADDQWDDRRTHNSELSYGALTARALEADYQIIAVSGIGLVTGYVEPTVGQIWNRLYPRPDAPVANLAGWPPDIVFFNFGENDAAHSERLEQPFPATYSARYLELVQQARAAYPHAWFVILRGGMGEGATNADLRRAWEEAVGRIEGRDPNVSHFVFTHWTKNHPRVADDQIMADELRHWLETQRPPRPSG